MEMGFKVVPCAEYRVLLWLHTANDPPSDEWAKALEQVYALKQERGFDMGKVRSLAITDGGAPDSLQRRSLYVECLAGHKVPSAAVSTVLINPLKRGIATAILWLNPSFQAFAPHQLVHTLTHLNLEAFKPTLMAGLEDLQGKLPPSETLRLLRNHS